MDNVRYFPVCGPSDEGYSKILNDAATEIPNANRIEKNSVAKILAFAQKTHRLSRRQYTECSADQVDPTALCHRGAVIGYSDDSN